jgi:hypothetical protein
MADKKTIERIMAEGFLPDPSLQWEQKGPRALEYIAFYLSRIDRTLASIDRKLVKKTKR